MVPTKASPAGDAEVRRNKKIPKLTADPTGSSSAITLAIQAYRGTTEPIFARTTALAS